MASDTVTLPLAERKAWQRVELKVRVRIIPDWRCRLGVALLRIVIPVATWLMGCGFEFEDEEPTA
jgi:hypothetical protein